MRNALTAMALAFAACSTPPNDTPDFVFVLHDDLVPADVAHLRMALDDARAGVLDKLEIDQLDTVTVQVWAKEEAYQAAMEADLGSRAPGSRGYVVSDSELRLLRHTMLSAQREAVHEFAHVATLNVNAESGNNPRWLWEGVAQYLAGEFIAPSESSIFDDGQCPSLATLNAPFDEGGTIYSAGYLLIDYIDETSGFDAVVELIREEGDVQAVLGMAPSEFEAGWCAHVRRTYL